ncbi:putative Ig domain-containing protein [Cnuibacter sp. UC19_7]|uniref:putative Ig domain-containing protein n=1 Tax=Cnuibacter sp. UC19_7 TaxID=3350166 RepID=UPI0036723420
MHRSRALTCLVATGIVAVAALGFASSASAAPEVIDPYITVPSGSTPDATVMNSAGDTFVLDTTNNKVLRYSPGNPTPFGYTLGAGAIARDIGIDGADNVYVSDNAGAIAQITRSGTFTPSWRSMPMGYTAGNIDVETDGTVHVVASGTNTLATFTQADTTASVKTLLGTARDVDSDAAGNVYVATSRPTVTRITPAGVIDDSYIGLEAGVDPEDLAVRDDGSLFVLDAITRKLFEYGATPGAPRVSSSGLTDVFEIALDSRGSAYFASASTSTVKSMPHADSTPTTVASFIPGSAAAAVTMTADQQLLFSYSRLGIVVDVPLLPKITSPTINSTGTVGTPFSTVITTSGLDDVMVSTGTLPAWLTFDPVTNTVSGTPTEAGTYTFEYSASNALGDTPDQTATITISGGPMPSPTPSPTGGSTAGGSTGGSNGTGSANTSSSGSRGTLASTGFDAEPLILMASLLMTAGAAAAFTRARRSRAR